MEYVVLDLEFNQPYKRNGRLIYSNKLQFEIIEIGAIKLDSNFEIIDNFRIYVKNAIYKNISPRVKEITGINEEDLKYGYDFTKANQLFNKWLGSDYKILAWGESDELVYKDNCRARGIAYKLNEFYDVQNACQILLGKYGKIISLEVALKLFKIPKQTDTHRALNDCKAVSSILKKIRNIDYSANIKKYIEEHNQKVDTQRNIFYGIDKRKTNFRCSECKSAKISKAITTMSKKHLITKAVCNNCNSTLYLNMSLLEDKPFKQVFCYQEDYNNDNLNKPIVKIDHINKHIVFKNEYMELGEGVRFMRDLIDNNILLKRYRNNLAEGD